MNPAAGGTRSQAHGEGSTARGAQGGEHEEGALAPACGGRLPELMLGGHDTQHTPRR